MTSWRNDRVVGTIVAVSFAAACSGRAAPAVTPGPRLSPALLRLQHDIDAFLSAPALEHSTWGVVVRSLERNDTLFAVNARKLLLPASNVKVITLASAAERLGWDFSFETRLVGAGHVNERVLEGDLVVVGTGDPSIDDWDGAATRLFHTWARQVKEGGVSAITGRIVGDDNWFDDQILGPGWAWDDLDNSFGATVGALQFNENTARLTIAPGTVVGQPASVTLTTPGSGLTIRNLLETVGPGLAATIDIQRRPGSAILELRGSVPLDAGPVARNVSVYNPTTYFLTALRDAFIANGIDVRGEVIDIDDIQDPPGHHSGTLLLSHRSPPLSTLAWTMMKNSQNVFAESLLNAIGAHGRTPAASTGESGRAMVRSILQEWGVPEANVLVADGSGLSRYNLATPEALVTILAHVYDDEESRNRFDATLPVAGRDGTLAQRMKGTAAEGNARAKSGAFSNARALSGYVRTADGEPLVFSIIANNFGTTPDVIEKTTDSIVVRLAEFKR